MIKDNRVNEIFRDCLFKNEELEDRIPPINEIVIVEGIRASYGFNSKRLFAYKDEINSMLDSMNETFKEGWSFLNLCFDKDDNQWTGSHSSMEELMCLGMGIGRVYYCIADREFWTILPGGMPYIVIK